MKARWPGSCGLCGDAWSTGASIEKFLNSYVHPDCKSNELARRRGDVVHLPANLEALDWWPSRKQVTSRTPSRRCAQIK